MRGKMSLTQLADALSRQLDRPVMDLTELTGVYEIDLEWTPDEGTARMPMGLPMPTPKLDGGAESHPVPEAGSSPSIFVALQEKLGLKLEGRKAPVEVLVIDHIEKVPTEN